MDKYIIEGRCFEVFLRMYLLKLNFFFFHQISVPIKNYEISVCIKYSFRDLIYGIRVCT